MKLQNIKAKLLRLSEKILIHYFQKPCVNWWQNSNLISAEKNKLIVEFPIELIADKEFSQYDSVDLVVQVLNQSDTLSDGIFLNYTSRWLRKNDFPGRTRIESAHFSINGRGYIGFGWDGDHFNATSDEFLKDLWEYDPINDTWEECQTFLP
jgi:hypothetical protein